MEKVVQQNRSLRSGDEGPYEMGFEEKRALSAAQPAGGADASVLRTSAPLTGALGVLEESGVVDIMPVISTFFGIIIRMFYREHGIPHFHAEYQGQQATFTFDGEPLAGSLRSRTALRLLKEWAIANRIELDANWNKAKIGDQLERIAPLE